MELTLVVRGKIGPKLTNEEDLSAADPLAVSQMRKLHSVQQTEILENEPAFATIKELKLNTNSAVNVINELSSI
jgi:hypothetical protein